VYQRNKINENTAKIAEQSTQMAELRRLVEECSQNGNMKPSTSSNQSESETKIKRAKKRSTDKPDKNKKKKQRMTRDTGK
jgi:hypothetical protein